MRDDLDAPGLAEASIYVNVNDHFAMDATGPGSAERLMELLGREFDASLKCSEVGYMPASLFCTPRASSTNSMQLLAFCAKHAAFPAAWPFRLCYASETVTREEVMSDWLNNPAVITTILSVSGALVGIGIWIGRVNSDREVFRAFIEKVEGNLETIADNIAQIFARISVMDRGSPLRLNELGRSIADSLGAKDWVADIAGSMRDAMREKSEYEIQQQCFEYFRSEFKPDEKQDGKLKDCAYQSGVPVSVVLDVLALEMRDILIAARQSSPDTSAASQPPFPQQASNAIC